MNLVIKKELNYSYIQVTNQRLDSFISPELKAELVMMVNKGENKIILDLKDCIYSDSSGLSSILVGNRLCEDTKGTFVICNLSEGVEKLVRLAMLDTILNIASDQEEAKKMVLQPKTIKKDENPA
jgi:anti-sigma B factor antagonist